MTQDDLRALLADLIGGWESETVEFKEGGEGFSTGDISKYISALANEANLGGHDAAWLVFGVKNSTREVVGTNYRVQRERLLALNQDATQSLEPRLPFRNIYELQHDAGRVILFEIPPAPRGMPIARNGFYYARHGESLSALSVDKLDEIRRQTVLADWTAVVVPDATIGDLDPDALARARKAFATKRSSRLSEDEVAAWTIGEFLERSQLTVDGGITRAALLLLGKSTSAVRLSPHMAQITWNLVGEERAYEHFSPPWLLATSEVWQRIRNVQIRLQPADSLLPIEVTKYEVETVLEALHNAIAHQDYNQMSRIIVTERVDRLEFTNRGSFFEGMPDEYALGARVTPGRYRNPFLVRAMAELNMIDTMGYGIHRMTTRQAKRYLPLPDFDLTTADQVTVTIYGSVVDRAYSQLLMKQTDLPLADVLALDRVQKKLPIPVEASRRLHRMGLVEGRRPHLHVAAVVAAATDTKAEYIRTRAQGDAFYMKLITDFIEQFGGATRAEIDDLLLDQLSERMTHEQKRVKVQNLLQKLRRDGRIVSVGPRKSGVWRMS